MADQIEPSPPSGDVRAPKGSSIAGASCNFVNSIIGAGIIGLPYAVHHCGFWTGLVLLVAVGAMTDYSVRLIVRTGMRVGATGYEDLCRQCYGAPGFAAATASMFFFAYGAMCAYFIVIGDTVPPVLADATGSSGSPLVSRPALILLPALLLVLPLCLLRSMDKLSRSSALSVAAVVFIIVTVVVRAPAAAAAANVPTHTLTVLEPRTVFAGVGAMSFAAVCHHSSFIVFSSLASPTVPNWRRVTHISLLVAIAASLVMALAGYLSFRGEVRGDIMNNFPPNDALVVTARLLLALTMVLTYPMEQFVARHAVLALAAAAGYPSAAAAADQSPGSASTRTAAVWFYAVTGALFLSSLAIALAVHDLGPVLELTGAVSASVLGYVLPILCHWHLDPPRAQIRAVAAAWAAHKAGTTAAPAQSVELRSVPTRHTDAVEVVSPLARAVGAPGPGSGAGALEKSEEGAADVYRENESGHTDGRDTLRDELHGSEEGGPQRVSPLRASISGALDLAVQTGILVFGMLAMVLGPVGIFSG